MKTTRCFIHILVYKVYVEFYYVNVSNIYVKAFNIQNQSRNLTLNEHQSPFTKDLILSNASDHKLNHIMHYQLSLLMIDQSSFPLHARVRRINTQFIDIYVRIWVYKFFGM